MKRLLLFLFFTAISLSGISQELTWNQRIIAINTIDSILTLYEDNLTLTDVSSDSISPKALRKFKSIFTSDALIFDDLNPPFFDDSHSKDLKFKSKSLDEFLAKTAEVYPRGLLDVRITNMVIGYDDLPLRSAIVAIEKKVVANTSNQLQVLIIDTVLLAIKLSPDYKGAKIERISEDGVQDGTINFRIINDSDGDYVSNETDNCPDVPGFVLYKGCEPPIGPFATLLFSGTVGFSSDKFDANQHSANVFDPNYLMGEYKQNPTSFPDVNLGAELEVFPGLKRQLGFGVGVIYTRINSNLNIDSYHIEFKDTFNVPGDHSEYKRIVTLDNGMVSENITFSYISIPIYAKLKKSINPKLDIKISLGGGLSLPIKQQIKTDESASSPLFNYEGTSALIKEATNNGDSSAIPGHDPLFNNSDVNYTEEFVTSINGTPEDFFSMVQNAGYDFALDSKIGSASYNRNFDPGVFFIIKPAITYLLASGIYLNLGVQYMWEQHANKGFTDAYKLTDEVGSNYTLLAGSPKVNHSYFGINIGVSFSLSKKYLDPQAY